MKVPIPILILLAILLVVFRAEIRVGFGAALDHHRARRSWRLSRTRRR